jgi:hypothetical protein
VRRALTPLLPLSGDKDSMAKQICALIYFVSLLLCNSCGADRNKTADDSEVLKKLKDASTKIQDRFRGMEKSPDFGKGLKDDLITEVKLGSDNFWSLIRNLKAEDIAGLSTQDGDLNGHIMLSNFRS